MTVDPVWAYYDESGEYDASGNLLNMTVGGCFSTLSKWQSFCGEWCQVLSEEGLEWFHMTDFEAWRPPYEFLLPSGERDHARHKNLLNRLLSIKLKYIEGYYGYSSFTANTTRKTAHSALLEDCIHGAISHAAFEAWEHYQRPLNLVFAVQPHFPEATLRKYIWFYDYGDAVGRISSTTMAHVKDVTPLQAADILAYEMGRVQRPGRPVRYPIKRIQEHAKANGLPMSLKWGPISSTKIDLSGVPSGRSRS